jgi:hypothetical protein
MPIGLLMAAAVLASPPPGGVLAGETAHYDAMAAAEARAADRRFSGSDCPDAKVETVSFTESKLVENPRLIAWREKVRVTGCGHSAVENINVARLGDEPPWRMAAGLPGETYTDTVLQSVVFPAAIAQAKIDLATDCQTATLSDIYVAARPGGLDVLATGAALVQASKDRPVVSLPATLAPLRDKLALDGAWLEVWPLAACGQDRTLGVVFIPLKDQSKSLYVFIPIWREVDANGVVQRPRAAPPEE